MCEKVLVPVYTFRGQKRTWVSCLSLYLILLSRGLFFKAEVEWLTREPWIVSSFLPIRLPVLGLQVYTLPCLAFYMESEDLNSVPYAYEKVLLLTEPSHSPILAFLIQNY